MTSAVKLGVLSFVLGALAGCATGATDASSSSAQPIVGGVVETRHPGAGYLLARLNTGDHVGEILRPICGATLIAERAVITSADCVVEQWSTVRTVVSVGFGDGLTGATYEVEGTWRDWIHPDYLQVWDNPDPKGEDFVYNDVRHSVAIIPLKQRVTGIAPLPIAQTAILPNTPALVIGYGRVTEGGWESASFDTDPLDRTKYPGTRKSAEVDIMNARVGILAYPRPDASGRSGGICIGDMGAPILLADGSIAGVLTTFARDDLTAAQFDNKPICRPDTGGEYVNLQWGKVAEFVAARLAALATPSR